MTLTIKTCCIINYNKLLRARIEQLSSQNGACRVAVQKAAKDNHAYTPRPSKNQTTWPTGTCFVSYKTSQSTAVRSCLSEPSSIECSGMEHILKPYSTLFVSFFYHFSWFIVGTKFTKRGLPFAVAINLHVFVVRFKITRKTKMI